MLALSFDNLVRTASVEPPDAIHADASKAKAAPDAFEALLRSPPNATASLPPASEPATREAPKEQTARPHQDAKDESPSAEVLAAKEDAHEAVDDPLAKHTDATSREDAPDEVQFEAVEVAAIEDAAIDERAAKKEETGAEATASVNDGKHEAPAIKSNLASDAIVAEEPEEKASETHGASEDAPSKERSRRGGATDGSPEERVPLPVAAGEGGDNESAEGEAPELEFVRSTSSEQPRAARGRETRREASLPVAKAVVANNAPVAEAAFLEQPPETPELKQAEVSEARPSTSQPQAMGREGASQASTSLSRFSEHLVGRGAERATRDSSLTESQQVRFVERVARAFQASDGQGGTLRLRLSPPELGSLRLEVRVQGSMLSAKIEADTPAARSLLLDNLPALRERLEEQGLRVDQFDVDLLDRQSSDSLAGRRDDTRQPADQAPRHTDSHREPQPSQEDAATARPTKMQEDDQQLNVIV